MKTIIFGAGCVGLSIALSLIKKENFDPKSLLIIDKYNAPSKGTSIKNSGVLHAGLYYKPGSLKAELCRKGSLSLSELCITNKLPLNQCGKILVPFCKEDYTRLEKIFKSANDNGCEVEFINYETAQKIQPGIVRKDKYLWSPKTSVFDPEKIMQHFYSKLIEKKVTFIKGHPLKIDNEKKLMLLSNGEEIKFQRFYNCAGSGSLDIANLVTDEFNNLMILPILGEYGIQTSGIKINTNLYPVPDPDLPFLGVHLTPRTNGTILIGPNAVPAIQKDIQKLELSDALLFIKRLQTHLNLFLSNIQNYRNHALSEVTLNPKAKFKYRSMQFLDENNRESLDLEMIKTTYGIRPQLLDKQTLNFVNDFIYKEIEGNLHVVNAVSPAFTSCLALGEYLTKEI